MTLLTLPPSVAACSALDAATPQPTKIVSHCGHKFTRNAVIAHVIDSIPLQSDTLGDHFSFVSNVPEQPPRDVLDEYGGVIAYFEDLRIPLDERRAHFMKMSALEIKAIAILDRSNPRSGWRSIGVLMRRGGGVYDWTAWSTRVTEPVCSWLPF